MKGIFGALLAPEAKMTSRELAETLGAGRESNSGTTVSWSTALQVSTVLACARVIAEGLAQVPFKLFQGELGGQADEEHPIYDLIYRRPNPWQTSFEWRETLGFHLVLTGDALCRKLRVGRAQELRSLEPVEPGKWRFQLQSDGRLRYWAQTPGGDWPELDPKDVWHIRGPSWNSYVGLDVTRLAREAIGLAIATEQSHADSHRNGSRIGGIYTVQGNLDQPKFEQLSKWMDRHSTTGDRAGKTLVLDNGAKFEAGQMTGVDAQHIETRKHQVEEICRAMRVMPIMVGQSDKASTYASAEQMFLAHVVHTLMPWFERLEQSADVNLLSEADRRAGYYTKFNPNALMRGAAKDRGEFYAKALGAGGTPAWMTQDEVRGLEEMAPKGGKAAELSEGAMRPAQKPQEETPTDA